eukprot:CAMPEP_0113233908 /NCGR_PEP_ID=MMETSP0008_2-20120614/2737_1 /TAXON_ID=97485 /ORGANISM="Prymnesium parvum" /LENGTH=49 /DNA_ID=CAMNT_0000080727 /DNA_START=419 /DNA_END=564 /DNA_ORIENTATION=- /assembly_acc=CAM_ASM_000153
MDCICRAAGERWGSGVEELQVRVKEQDKLSELGSLQHWRRGGSGRDAKR